MLRLTSVETNAERVVGQRTPLIDSQKLVFKVVTDFVGIFVVVFCSHYGLRDMYFKNTIQRGFFCDDESIRYPYKSDTIPSDQNMIQTALITGITIIIFETGWFFLRQKRQPQPQWMIFYEIYCQLSPFIFGLFVSEWVTDICKNQAGRMRPNFIDVCQPNNITLDNPEICQQYGPQYITNYTCTNMRMKLAWADTHRSFISGHSSFSSYCMVYLVIYLQSRLTWERIGFIKPLLQAGALYLAIYTGLTRVSDNKHHWSDVCAGLIEGTVCAILITLFVAKVFKTIKSPETESQLRLTMHNKSTSKQYLTENEPRLQ